jgi:hypothetical protein
VHLLLSVVERRGLVVELRLDERVVVLQESEKKAQSCHVLKKPRKSERKKKIIHLSKKGTQLRFFSYSWTKDIKNGHFPLSTRFLKSHEPYFSFQQCNSLLREL